MRRPHQFFGPNLKDDGERAPTRGGGPVGHHGATSEASGASTAATGYATGSAHHQRFL